MSRHEGIWGGFMGSQIFKLLSIVALGMSTTLALAQSPPPGPGCDACGSSGGAGVPPTDATTVTSVPVECKDGAAPVFGGFTCTDPKTGIIPIVEGITMGIIAKRNTCSYEGLRTYSLGNFGGLLATPTCDIEQGEGMDLGQDFQYRQ